VRLTGEKVGIKVRSAGIFFTWKTFLGRGRSVPAADLGAFPAAANDLEIAIIGAGLDHPDLRLFVDFTGGMTGVVAIAQSIKKLAGLRRLDHSYRLFAGVLLEK
jgi:hypothetical protein